MVAIQQNPIVRAYVNGEDIVDASQLLGGSGSTGIGGCGNAGGGRSGDGGTNNNKWRVQGRGGGTLRLAIRPGNERRNDVVMLR